MTTSTNAGTCSETSHPDLDNESTSYTLEQNIVQGFFQRASASSRQVHVCVDVAGRLITLGGIVPSFHLRQVFCHLCRKRAPGFYVDDRLRVADDSAPLRRLAPQSVEDPASR
jgi:hypothetical protein